MHFVGLARGLAGYIVPSRLYGILAAGRPVIVGADKESETAQVVERVGAGVTIPPGQPTELARVIREAYEGRLDLDGMGARAREFVVAEADRSVSIARYEAVFREALASRARD
jgi:colanic acid biosynthesis glycosyl transferase WcaI